MHTVDNWAISLQILVILNVPLLRSEGIKSIDNVKYNKKLETFGEAGKKCNYSYRQLGSWKELNNNQHLRKITNNQDGFGRNRRSVQGFSRNISTDDTLTCPKKYSCCPTCIQETKHWRKCECDTHCTFFNDCCADYEQYQGNVTTKTPARLKFAQLSCVNYFSNTPIWVVNKCPKNKRGNEISFKCQNVNKESWIGNNIHKFIPVHGRNNLVYRNEYCAKCNGEKQIHHFMVKITCDILPPSSMTKINEKFMFAAKYCGNDSITFQAKDDYNTRMCFPNLTKSCPSTNPYHERCVEGPVGVVSANRTNYRNMWCVKCRGGQYIPLRCGPHIESPIKRPGKTVPLSLVLDINNNDYSIRVQASCANSYYDTKLEICLKSLRKQKVPKKKNVEKYLVAVWFSSEKFTDWVYKGNIYSSLRKTFNIEMSQMDKLSFVKRRPHYFVVTFRLRLTEEQTLGLAKQENETMHSQAKTPCNSYNSPCESRTSLPLKRLLFFTSEFNITIRKHIFTVIKTTYRQLACINIQTYEKYILLGNGSYYINSSGKTYDERQVYFEESRISAQKNISVCEQVVLSDCHGYQITLNESEYIKFENLSIFHNGTNKIYKFGEYDIKNSKAVVCTFPPLKIRIPHESDTQVTLTYLTFIGIVVSLFCLFLVILTYVIFSELRSVPGKNILNLSVSLFLAQLTWLTAVGQSSVPVLCHVISVLEHYLFLVSFAAMAMTAYHTYYMFSSNDVPRKDVPRKDENRICLKYCITTWCIPAVFVGMCVVLDRQSIYTIYRNDQLQICWFNNKEAQEYLFVLPVGVSLLFNVVCFILTVAHIHTKRSATVLISSYRTKPSRTMFWIYLKIATLMGFGWLFGVLDHIVNSSIIFSYLFVIFTSLQGVYIAIAFIMNKRVFKMFKNLTRRKISKRYELAELDGVVAISVSRNSTNCTKL